MNGQAWLLFGSGTLAAAILIALQREVMRAEWERERAGIMGLDERPYARAAWRAESVRAVAAGERRDPLWMGLEGAQMATLSELRRRAQAGEFADDMASVEQARMGWARWAVSHGVFGEHPAAPAPAEAEEPAAETEEAEGERDGAQAG